MRKSCWRFLRFVFERVLYEWRVLPFGLTCSPRVFTKVVKQVLSFLRRMWQILVSAFLDDFLIQASSYNLCCLHMQLTALVLLACGFELNFKKSSPIPSQSMTHLGFIWNTRDMTITVPQVLVGYIHLYVIFLAILSFRTKWTKL